MEDQNSTLKYGNITFREFHEVDNINILKKALHIKKINSFQKIKIKLFGKTLLGNIQVKGWKTSLPFYAFNCQQHGLQITYPTGWRKKLVCPTCLFNATRSLKNE